MSAQNPSAGSGRLAAALALARETKALLIEPGALRHGAPLFAAQFPGRKALVVADTTTFAVAGIKAQDALAAAGLAESAPLILPAKGLYAEYRWVEVLQEHFARHDAVPVAVGSGTINDLVKLAAHLTGRSYLCVATAASMDGYTAYGASITRDGSKQTFACPAPQAVLADLDILAAAPPAMTASGYADLQAKLTAGADWILADELGVEPIDPEVWAIVQDDLRTALAAPAAARAGEPAAIAALTTGLMLGGFAMQRHQTSRPASGAEHQFSHLWDMEHLTGEDGAPSHGFKVGVATLAVAALYEAMLRRPLEHLDVAACCAAWPDWSVTEKQIHTLFGAGDFIATPLREAQIKHPSREALHDQLQRLKSRWPQLRDRVRKHLPPAAALRRNLELAGAPVTPEAIGLTQARLRDSFLRACHIRRRFTVLDLAVRTGLLDECLAEIFPAAPV